MGGLVFLLAMGLWFAACVYLALNIPKWLGVLRFRWALGLLIFPVLLVAPLIDEVLGMRQFEQLCKERAVVLVHPSASQVKRAKEVSLPTVELSGYWITIRAQPVEYIDVDTGKPFLTYQGFHTKGGRIAGIALMGGTHSCWPKNDTEILKQLDIDKLLEQGKK